MNQTNVIFNNPIPGSVWSPIYKWAAYLSVIMLLFIPVQVIIFAISPPPESVLGFYQLFHSNWLLGLLSMDFLYIINNVIIIFIYLALFVRLFDEFPSICFAAFIIGLVGIACYYSSNPAFEILTLSNKYFASSIDQGYYLAAGEALMAGYSGTAFDVYYVLNAFTLLLFSYAILKSKHFTKTIGWWGIASGILMIIPSSAGLLGIIFSLLSLIPWVVFLFLVTKRFFRFSKASIL